MSFKSACFALMLLGRKLHCTFYLTYQLRSPLARAPYVVLFDLKPLNKDGNLQVLYACTKRSLRSPQTHFRACKTSKIFWGRTPRPPFHMGPSHPLGGPDYLYGNRLLLGRVIGHCGYCQDGDCKGCISEVHETSTLKTLS